jgi:intracellular sulfur oxidation DsrE/DsrF family protein
MEGWPMEKIARQNVLAVLTKEWGNYVSKFQGLSPEAQAAFLKKHGYQRLADLLAHIGAWWEVGLQVIENFRTDPDARQPEIDVDIFNAKAVEKVRNAPDGEVIQSFEKMRRKFVDCVTNLSEADFQNEKIVNQIKMELINHLEDHKIQ